MATKGFATPQTSTYKAPTVKPYVPPAPPKPAAYLPPYQPPAAPASASSVQRANNGPASSAWNSPNYQTTQPPALPQYLGGDAWFGPAIGAAIPNAKQIASTVGQAAGPLYATGLGYGLTSGGATAAGQGALMQGAIAGGIGPGAPNLVPGLLSAGVGMYPFQNQMSLPGYVGPKVNAGANPSPNANPAFGVGPLWDARQQYTDYLNSKGAQLDAQGIPHYMTYAPKDYGLSVTAPQQQAAGTWESQGGGGGYADNSGYGGYGGGGGRGYYASSGGGGGSGYSGSWPPLVQWRF